MEEEDRLAKLEEEENNPMKALENRTVDSKREMDILDALQDIRARNARNERVGQDVDLEARITPQEVETEEDMERGFVQVGEGGGIQGGGSSSSMGNRGGYESRVHFATNPRAMMHTSLL